jgi:uncharacterized protein (TIGR04168 family)
MAIELFVIGDVHGMWDDADRAFLEGRASTAIFVGDFGDEDVPLVERLAAVRSPKAIMFGNHDAWNAMRGRGPHDAVERELALAGDDFIGYRSKLIADGRIALVGGRPFSWGGGWFDRSFYEPLFGVRNMKESAERITEAGMSVAAGIPLVFVGHNGPRGLGAEADSIWGRDFQTPPVDWGDADQQHAIDTLRAAGRTIVAGVAGHMHEQLLLTDGKRTRCVAANGTTFVNSAVVPRHRHKWRTILRHFVRVEIDVGIDGTTVTAEDIWVDDDGAVAEQKILTPSPSV